MAELPYTDWSERDGLIQAALNFLYMPDASGAPIPPILRADRTSLRHLIIFPNRVSQTVVDEHKLEASYLWKGNRPASRQQPVGRAGECESLGKGDPSKQKEMSCGTTHYHPKTVVVVAVVRMVVVTIGRARVVTVVAPRAAAQDAPFARLPRVRLPVLVNNLIV